MRLTVCANQHCLSISADHLLDVPATCSAAFFSASKAAFEHRLTELKTTHRAKAPLCLTDPVSRAQLRVNAACRDARDHYISQITRNECKIFAFYDSKNGPRLAKLGTDLVRKRNRQRDLIRLHDALTIVFDHDAQIGSTKRSYGPKRRRERPANAATRPLGPPTPSTVTKSAVVRAYATVRRLSYLLFLNPCMDPLAMGVAQNALHIERLDDLTRPTDLNDLPEYTERRAKLSAAWLTASTSVVHVHCASEADLTASITSSMLVQTCNVTANQIMVHSPDSDFLSSRTAACFGWIVKRDTARTSFARPDKSGFSEQKQWLLLDKKKLEASEVWLASNLQAVQLRAVFLGNDYVVGGLPGCGPGLATSLSGRPFNVSSRSLTIHAYLTHTYVERPRESHQALSEDQSWPQSLHNFLDGFRIGSHRGFACDVVLPARRSANYSSYSFRPERSLAS